MTDRKSLEFRGVLEIRPPPDLTAEQVRVARCAALNRRRSSHWHDAADACRFPVVPLVRRPHRRRGLLGRGAALLLVLDGGRAVMSGAVMAIMTIALMMEMTGMMAMRSAAVLLLLLVLLIVRAMIVGGSSLLLTRHEDARAEIGAVGLDGAQQHLQLILLERLEELLAPHQSAGILIVILARVAAAAALMESAGSCCRRRRRRDAAVSRMRTR